MSQSNQSIIFWIRDNVTISTFSFIEIHISCLHLHLHHNTVVLNHFNCIFAISIIGLSKRMKNVNIECKYVWLTSVQLITKYVNFQWLWCKFCWLNQMPLLIFIYSIYWLYSSVCVCVCIKKFKCLFWRHKCKSN